MMWAEAEKAVQPQGMQVEGWKKEREIVVVRRWNAHWLS